MDGTKNDRNHTRFALFMPFQSSFHLKIINIVRVHKVWTNKKQNDLSSIELFFNFLQPFGTSINITVMPNFDKALPSQRTEMCLELVQKRFIFTSITEEDFYGHKHLP